ncbi:ubiquinone biosynthesis COQ9-like protein [Wolffia australiana]
MIRSMAVRRVPLEILRRRILPLLRFSTSADLPSDSSLRSSSGPPKYPEADPVGAPKPPKGSPTVGKSPAAEEAAGRVEPERQKERVRTRIGDYAEEQSRVLRAALEHVMKLGWSDSALMAGARDVGLSPSIVGSFPRKEASLVEFFMDDCLDKLVDKIESNELNLDSLILSDRLSKLIRLRLEMQGPYISKWAQALSIQGQPQNVPISFKQRVALIDEIWHAAGDQTADIDWYIKRAVLGGIYSAAEIFMLTDNSPEFHDTWLFLHRRIKDAFDIQKSVQEAAYLAEAVGAGVGNSVQALLRRVSQGF